MDKQVILAVAGAGKTSFILDKLCLNEKSILITYTKNNYDILRNAIIKKFAEIPKNIYIYTYFQFLYTFCFKPFEGILRTRGLDFKNRVHQYTRSNDISYYYNQNSKLLYHYRLAKLCEQKIDLINARLEKYFDNLFIDEVQDFTSHDFNFIMSILKSNLNIYYVGDFYQHNFPTSIDGNTNQNLYDDYEKYKEKIHSKYQSIIISENLLIASYRCTDTICSFIREELFINIESHKTNSSELKELTNENEINEIIQDDSIVKLFYQNSTKYNIKSADNWGKSKGSTFVNTCVILNANTYRFFKQKQLNRLPPITRNKLYVALTRSENNVYLVEEKKVANFKR